MRVLLLGQAPFRLTGQPQEIAPIRVPRVNKKPHRQTKLPQALGRADASDAMAFGLVTGA
jgi:hypothetical protein